MSQDQRSRWCPKTRRLWGWFHSPGPSSKKLLLPPLIRGSMVSPREAKTGSLLCPWKPLQCIPVHSPSLVLTPTITILNSPSLSPARALLGRRSTLGHTSSHPVTISKGGSSISSFSFSGSSRSSRSSPFCEAGAEASAASSFWAMDGLWLGSHWERGETAVLARGWQQSPKQLSAAKSAGRWQTEDWAGQPGCAYPLSNRLYNQRPPAPPPGPLPLSFFNWVTADAGMGGNGKFGHWYPLFISRQKQEAGRWGWLDLPSLPPPVHTSIHILSLLLLQLISFPLFPIQLS